MQRAAFLARFIPPGGVGAELGVHKGYFSKVLAERLAPQRLYLVDPWYLQGAFWTWGEGNRRIVDALSSILHDLEKELVSGQVVLRIDWDIEALAAMPDACLDWVYLDTTHQYDQTQEELAVLKSKVKPNGIIAGDDWRPEPSHEHHGVFKAVQEFVAREGFALDADEEIFQWVVRRA